MTGEIYSLDENGWKWTDSLWKALETGAVSNPLARMWGKKRTGIVSVVGAGGVSCRKNTAYCVYDNTYADRTGRMFCERTGSGADKKCT